MKKSLAVCAGIFLAGCSSTGPVQIDKDTYMISKQSAGGAFVQPASIRVDIIREATAFCAKSGKTFQMTNFTDTANFVSALPSSEIHFKCV